MKRRALFLLLPWLAPAAPPSLTGRWRFDIRTTSGDGVATLILRQTGPNVTGVYIGVLGQYTVTGAVEARSFRLRFQAILAGTPFLVRYTGRIGTPTTLSGEVSLGPAGAGAFTASREK